jgi:hypothetical protein
MYVHDLIAELTLLPPNAWVDASFGTGAAFAVVGVEPLDLPDGRTIAIINIVDGVPLKAV